MGSGSEIAAVSPVDGSLLGNVQTATVEDYENLIERAEHAFLSFRKIPAPQRGELVRQFGNKLREKKIGLGAVGLLGDGKIPSRRSGRSARDDRHL